METNNWALVLTYGNLQYTRLCVGDILAQDVPMSILLVVNQPPEADETPAWADSVAKALHHDPVGRKLVPLVMASNLGCAGGWNLGLRMLFGMGVEQVLVAGNDARMRPDTCRLLFEDPRGAVFTCWTPSLEAMEQGVVGNPHLLPPQWNDNPDVGPVHMMRKRFFEAVGGYDEKFWPIYYEDTDFYRRAGLLGLSADSGSIKLPSFHSDGGSRSIRKSDETEAVHHPRFLRCRARYEVKWGGLPPDEQYTVPFNGEADPDEGPVNQ